MGRTIGTRREENVSYENVTLLIKVTLPYFMITSILEVIIFLLYNRKVLKGVNTLFYHIIFFISFTHGRTSLKTADFSKEQKSTLIKMKL